MSSLFIFCCCQESPYPTEEELQQALQTQVDWDAHRESLIEYTRICVQMEKANINDSRALVEHWHYYQSTYYGYTCVALSLYVDYNSRLNVNSQQTQLTLNQCWCTVGPTSSTLDQVPTNIDATFCVCWVTTFTQLNKCASLFILFNYVICWRYTFVLYSHKAVICYFTAINY